MADIVIHVEKLKGLNTKILIVMELALQYVERTVKYNKVKNK